MTDCYYDADFEVHSDTKNHTGDLLTMGKGEMKMFSIKKKINTNSSTET